ncbi:MarR family winged helix-turn-helix transcriptional regulator [Fodinibius sediminis]|uniref:Transcriptional regulator, MarR family n=1 Tax=Fodinibius sediminis TaxID=1214077 RepID=A0A521BEM3_9BACT|nr:MarR family transcriptional regulator [Fodinibius sediminis]SMO45519.1 transcriptional regulator, MarR family [Fodinibius sediminis]
MGTHYQGSEKEVKTLNAFIKLMRASESINNRLNRHLVEQDLTLSQFGVLEALLHLGPLNQKALGEKLLKSGGNITLVVDNLEKSGWVERHQNPEDRRSMLIHLTEEGEKLISSYFPQHVENIMAEFAPLSNEELDQLAAICKKIGLQSPDNNSEDS